MTVERLGDISTGCCRTREKQLLAQSEGNFTEEMMPELHDGKEASQVNEEELGGVDEERKGEKRECDGW